MPKPESISPTAIVQVFEPLGSTGTHLLKKIARHHRQQTIRPIHDVLRDAVKMKRDIRERSVSVRRAKLEAAYRWFQTRCEKMLLDDITAYTGFNVHTSEARLKARFDVSLTSFRDYFVEKNPNHHFKARIGRITVKDDDNQKDITVTGFEIEVDKRNFPEFFVED